MKIAGHTAKVCSLFESTPQYFRAYLTQEEATLFFTVTPQELAAEQARLKDEAIREGMRTRVFSDPFLERSVIQQKFAQALLCHDILLLHGSTVAVDGKAYLFTAKCGTGKSTHTRLWRELFGDRAVMVNDDKPLLRIAQDRVYVCGSPWNGKHCLGTNMEVPLKGLCILTRAEENSIVPVEPLEAMPVLLQQCHRPKDPAAMSKVLELLNKLSTRTGLYRLGCNMDPEAAVVAYNGMNRKENA